MKTLEQKEIHIATETDLLRSILKDRDFLERYAVDLAPSLFRPVHQPIVVAALKYWQQYRKLIPNTALVQELQHTVGTNFTQEQFQGTLEILHRLSQQPHCPEYTHEHFENYIRQQRIENALSASIDILKKVNKDRDVSLLDEIPVLIQRAADQSFNADVTDEKQTIPPMHEDCMHGWLGDKARELDSPLGYAYPAMLAVAASMAVPHDEHVRPTLYVALLGPKGNGKSETIKRARRTVFLGEETVRETVPGSDKGLYHLFEAETYKGKTVLLSIDELRNLMSKINITHSSLAPVLCTLWNQDKTGGSDKTGDHVVDIKLNILGGLKCDDPDEFTELFGSETTAGLADRMIFGWGEDFSYHRVSIIPENRVTDACPISNEIFSIVDQWRKQAEDRGRLGELALRIALITSSMNQDAEVTEESIRAALRFMEWQEQLRSYFKPSEAIVLDGTISEAILSALKPGKVYKWNKLASNRHWYSKYGSHKVASSRDSLVREGMIEYNKSNGLVWKSNK